MAADEHRFGGAVVRIDPATGSVAVVADEFVSPGALKLEAGGATALVLDHGAEIERVELAAGNTTSFATLPAGFAVDAADGGDSLHVAGDAPEARIVLADGLAGPVGLTRASADAVYVSESPGGRVRRVSLDGTENTIVADELD
jgi:sugar lactone lactonase YvrE